MKRIIGFIGAGNMATAIYTGILNNKIAEAQDLILFDIDGDKRNAAKERIGCMVAKSNREVVEKSDIVFLARETAVYRGTSPTRYGTISNRNRFFVSIVAGLDIDTLKRLFGPRIAGFYG